MKRLATILIALLCSAEAVIADAPEHPYGRLFVTAVNATEGTAGGARRLRLTVSNETGEDFHLQGVVTPVAESAVLVGRTGQSEAVALDSVLVPQDGVLDLNTLHMWVKLTHLRRALSSGDEFSVELDFGGFRIVVEPHIHG